MSDLLSPIFVVFDCNEADAFWGLVGVMKFMVRFSKGLSAEDTFRRKRSKLMWMGWDQESNFLRDQSGMKRQLSTLQQLIGVMDPELYAHLGEQTTS